MKRTGSFILFLFSVVSFAYGQSFLDKHFFISGGFSLSPVTSDEKLFSGGIQCSYDYVLFPLKTGIELGWATQKSTVFSVTADWKALRNSTLRRADEVEVGNGYYQGYVKLKDHHEVYSNAFQYGVNFKWFPMYAPVGPYFHVGVDYYLVNSRGYTTLRQEAKYYWVERKLDPWKARTSLGGVHFGAGKTELIGYHWLLDAGMKVNLSFPLSRASTDYVPRGVENGYDFEQKGKELARYAIPANVFSSNLIELYVKIGYKH